MEAVVEGPRVVALVVCRAVAFACLGVEGRRSGLAYLVSAADFLSEMGVDLNVGGPPEALIAVARVLDLVAR